MKLYENVVIGNFLYGLGHSIGHATLEKRQLSVINLLQQTPADKELGDMLLEFPGVVRLIEFKNKASSLTKEKDRCEQLTIQIGNNEELQRISKEIHWYVETEPFKESCLNNITPYLNAFSGDKSTHTIESFIESITQSVVAPQSTIAPSKLKAYLAMVSTCQGSGKIGTGGLIVSVGQEGVRYLQFADIMQLRLQHKDYVLQVTQEFDSVMEKNQKKEHKQGRSFSRGRSR
ncbi:hypothetical protein [Moritella viscosa]|uniref:Uncharacterized protein n=1 Tax=Moritella viscosa TaxID=80854 RepID=A0ABY1HKG4_9GAMM|nr:hypothetical protein [Moritella viscosa]SGZ00102.1 Putative uncharacterized protein [Moritella viscosa]SGZ16728.1 Putative uncharacterized protein [Moritella viscosa]SHO28152.1 Putative uncharacterized protein [Moritella viscosa]